MCAHEYRSLTLAAPIRALTVREGLNAAATRLQWEKHGYPDHNGN
jgi:hypothetical protein